MRPNQEIFFVAGEPSGDLHAAGLARQLVRWRGLKLTGAGGAEMRRVGVQTDIDSSGWGTVGLAESLRRVPYLLFQKGRMVRLITQRQPALVLLADFGAFNVRLARSVKRHCPGQRVAYYFPPSSWSRQQRDWSFLAQLTDLVITPFKWSAEILSACGVEVQWVGHPVIDRISPPTDRAEFRRQHDLPTGEPVIGLLPGSREVERRCIGPQLLAAAEVIKSSLPAAHFLWSVWPPEQPGRLDRRADEIDGITSLGNSDTLIMASDMVITAAGTATLEAAAAGCPMIMVYRGTWPMVIQYWLSDFGTQFYAMPNIVVQRSVVPELIQWDVNPKRISEEVMAIYHNAARWDQMKRDLAEVRAALGPPGASRRAAEIIAELLGLSSDRPHSAQSTRQHPAEDDI